LALAQVAGVAIRAAVLMVRAAVGLDVRAAAPAARRELAASVLLGARAIRAGGGRGLDAGRKIGERLGGNNVGHEGALHALALAQIAGVAIRAAVLMVRAAVGLDVRAATPAARGELAASVLLGARASRAGGNGDINGGLLDGNNVGEGLISNYICKSRALHALALAQVASVSVGATMLFV